MLNSWMYSLAGGLLILGSSAISGVYVAKLESLANKLDEKTANLKIELSQADRAYEIANIHSGLGYIQRAVIKYSVFQDKDIQATWDRVHAASLYTEILNLRSANGLKVTESEVKPLKELRTKVEAGDRNAYEKLQEISAELTEQSGTYRGDLVIKIAEQEVKKSEISSNISLSREIAIFTQLAGLFVLLIKDLPLSRKKHITNQASGTPKSGAPS